MELRINPSVRGALSKIAELDNMLFSFAAIRKIDGRWGRWQTTIPRVVNIDSYEGLFQHIVRASNIEADLNDDKNFYNISNEDWSEWEHQGKARFVELISGFESEIKSFFRILEEANKAFDVFENWEATHLN